MRLCEVCQKHAIHRDDAMERRCNGCEWHEAKCICVTEKFDRARGHIFDIEEEL
jgi:hypothetical protein